MGLTGLRHWGGFVVEEWLRQLQDARQAAEVYREMIDNDPIIGAILYAIEMLCRGVEWRVDPAGDTKADEEAALFLESCLHDMSMTWEDTISEILGMLGYGWSWHEIVYKRRIGPFQKDPTRRSDFTDGRIGWRKLPIRSQDSIWKFEIDETGGIQALTQAPPPDYILRTIPIEKSLLFRTKILKNNPLGRSILRNAWTSYYYAKNIRTIEAIGIERDLAGIPVLRPPEGVDIWDTKDPKMAQVLAAAKQIVTTIKRDEQDGVVLPHGWELSLLSTGGRRQFDTTGVITRYEQRMATTVLADFVLLGQDKVGSFSLANTKQDLFKASLAAYLDQIAGVFNRYAVPRLFELNAFPGITAYPTLAHAEVEPVNLEVLGAYVLQLSQAGAAILPDEGLERYLLEAGNLPVPPEQQVHKSADRRHAAEVQRIAKRLRGRP
ncbi:MAG: hypothetical protein KGL39_17490 [Patescibacteria group bacterium]|nr:hypothetical protein [Patescibacteria group bacterium]